LEALRKARQRLMGFLLRHGRSYDAKRWTWPHRLNRTNERRGGGTVRRILGATLASELDQPLLVIRLLRTPRAHEKVQRLMEAGVSSFPIDMPPGRYKRGKQPYRV
jgi:hypothetical protein